MRAGRVPREIWEWTSTEPRGNQGKPQGQDKKIEEENKRKIKELGEGARDQKFKGELPKQKYYYCHSSRSSLLPEKPVWQLGKRKE